LLTNQNWGKSTTGDAGRGRVGTGGGNPGRRGGGLVLEKAPWKGTGTERKGGKRGNTGVRPEGGSSFEGRRNAGGGRKNELHPVQGEWRKR